MNGVSNALSDKLPLSGLVLVLIFCLTGAVLLRSDGNVEAKTKMVSLEKYVKDSDAIFVGKIEQVEETNETYLVGPEGASEYYHVARVSVEIPIRENLEKEEIVHLYFRSKSSVEKRYEVGNRYLMFLFQHKNKWHSYHGYGGSIEIGQDGMLDYIYMDGEERQQDASKFIEKVRSTLAEIVN